MHPAKKRAREKKVSFEVEEMQQQNTSVRDPHQGFNFSTLHVNLAYFYSSYQDFEEFLQISYFLTARLKL